MEKYFRQLLSKYRKMERRKKVFINNSLVFHDILLHANQEYVLIHDCYLQTKDMKWHTRSLGYDGFLRRFIAPNINMNDIIYFYVDNITFMNEFENEVTKKFYAKSFTATNNIIPI